MSADAAPPEWSASPVWRRARLRRALRAALPTLGLAAVLAVGCVAWVEARAEAALYAVGTDTQVEQQNTDGEAIFIAMVSPAASEAADVTLAEARRVEGSLPWAVALGALALLATWAGAARPGAPGARSAQALAVR